MVTKEESRERAAEAGAKFVRDGAAVYVPKIYLPLLEMDLADNGMKLKLEDDGEDDGVMVLVAVPSSSVLAAVMADEVRRLRGGWAAFLTCAVLFAVVPLLGWYPILQGVFMAWIVVAAVGLIQAHRSHARHGRLRAHLAGRGM